MKIWMCEDLESPEDSGFGRTKRDAERYVSGNRGFDEYTGAAFRACMESGWCKPAVRIDVPKPAALLLLKTCSL